MSVRVHKAIGYGMRAFQATQAFQDKVLNDETTVGDFTRWCAKNLCEIQACALGDRNQIRWTMFHCDLDAEAKSNEPLIQHCVFQSEFGIADAVLFIPLGFRKAWVHFDDSIDWSEETELHGQQNRFVPLKRELSPYAKDKPPLTIAALALWCGVPEIYPHLQESLYVYWS
jgi:hypothetical protein